MKHFWNNIEGWISCFTLYKEAVDRAPVDELSIFVEIGTYKGRSAAFMGVEIINSDKPITFYTVDHFKGSAEHNNLADLYVEAWNNLAPLAKASKARVRVWSIDSITASKNFKDNTLDFVFIDGSHDYDSVVADINAWFPKVKKGGILAGDDYVDVWPDVIRAVNEEFGEHNVRKVCNQWAITK